MLALADIANDDGIAWPGVEAWLHAQTRLTGRAVRKIINEQLAIGDESELEVRERPGRTNVYAINVKLLEGRLEGRAEKISGVGALSVGEPLRVNDGSAEVEFRGGRNRSSGVVENDPQSPQASQQRTPRGEVYDALVAECYPAGAALTGKEKQKVALAALNIASAGGTADDVRVRVARYRAHKTYGGVALTAMSISQHWAELAPPARRLSSAPCVECEVGGGMHAAGCTRAAA